MLSGAEDIGRQALCSWAPRQPLGAGLLAAALGFAMLPGAHAADLRVSVEQITSGQYHHFFGYIGQCRTIPWNATGQYILGLEIDRIDRMTHTRHAWSDHGRHAMPCPVAVGGWAMEAEGR